MIFTMVIVCTYVCMYYVRMNRIMNIIMIGGGYCTLNLCKASMKYMNICMNIILVSWLRGRSKEKLCVHKPCSTGQ